MCSWFFPRVCFLSHRPHRKGKKFLYESGVNENVYLLKTNFKLSKIRGLLIFCTDLKTVEMKSKVNYTGVVANSIHGQITVSKELILWKMLECYILL